MDKKDLWCPFAARSVSVKTNGVITTCCNGTLVIDSKTGLPFTTNTHTVEQAFYSSEFQQIRDNLENGVRDKNCKECWQIEDDGGESPRLKEIRWFGENNPRSTDLQVIDLALGNQCNLKCRTCNPIDSTFWAKEYYELDFSTKEIKFDKFQRDNIFRIEASSDFYQSLKKSSLRKIKELHFFGGEPWMIKTVWELLEHAIEKDYAKNIELSFNTNCTFWDENKIKILDQFDGVGISLSLDGVGNRFEYMRHPAKWINVFENLTKMLEWKAENPDRRYLLTHFTASSYNIYYLDEVIELSRKFNLPFFINPVANPNRFAIQHIPRKIKEEIYNKFERTIEKSSPVWDEVQKVYGYMNGIDGEPEKWQSFLLDLNMRDKYRGESYSKTFPEFYELIEKYQT